MDKVLIPLDLWYKVLDAIEDNKELRQQCYDSQVNVYSQDIEWIAESLKAEGRHIPRVKDYLKDLAARIDR